jgi:hypothetical protein
MRWFIGVVIAAVLSPALLAADWKSIRPDATSEAELIDAFGPPDEVVSTFPWAEWSAKWKKRPKSSHYILRYTVQSSKSELLVGPAGAADDAEVHIYDGVVGVVKWHYGGPSARAAAAMLRADPEVRSGPVESMSRGARETEGGWITSTVGPGDAQVEVVLALK